MTEPTPNEAAASFAPLQPRTIAQLGELFSGPKHAMRMLNINTNYSVFYRALQGIPIHRDLAQQIDTAMTRWCTTYLRDEWHDTTTFRLPDAP